MLVKKIVFVISFLLLFIFILAILWGINYGLFSSVQFTVSHVEKMKFISSKHKTYYTKVFSQIDSVEEYIFKTNQEVGITAIVINEEPINASLNRLQVSGGLLYTDSFFLEDSLFKITPVDSGRVIRCLIRAHPQIAPYKVYPALAEWLNSNNYERDTNRVIVQKIYSGGEIEIIYPLKSRERD